MNEWGLNSIELSGSSCCASLSQCQGSQGHLNRRETSLMLLVTAALFLLRQVKMSAAVKKSSVMNDLPYKGQCISEQRCVFGSQTVKSLHFTEAKDAPTYCSVQFNTPAHSYTHVFNYLFILSRNSLHWMKWRPASVLRSWAMTSHNDISLSRFVGAFVPAGNSPQLCRQRGVF